MKKNILYVLLIAGLSFSNLTSVFAFWKSLDACIVPSLCKECIIGNHLKKNSINKIKTFAVLPLNMVEAVSPMDFFLNSKTIESFIIKNNAIDKKGLDTEGFQIQSKQCWIECRDKEVVPKPDKIVFRITEEFDKNGTFIVNKGWSTVIYSINQ